MKNILVPIDFGAKSLGALSTAVNVAKLFESKIVLLHIVDLDKKLSNSSYEDTVTGVMSKDLLQEKAEKLLRLNELIKNKGLEGSVTPMVIAGDILSVVERTIESENIDVIIMGSDGASGLKEFFIGSNAEKIARRMTVPVLIQKNAQGVEFDNVAFASDFSQDNCEACKVIKVLENSISGAIHMVRVNTPMDFKNTPLALKQMRLFASELGLKTDKVQQFDYLDFEEGLVAFVRENNIDCLIIAVHENKSLSDRFHLSSLGSLINHIQIPILVLKI